MILTKLLIIFIFIVILFFSKKFLSLNWKKKFLNAKKLKLSNKENLNKWMSLTKKERYNITSQESITYLNKRKVLLEEIRKEYKKIAKGKSK